MTTNPNLRKILLHPALPGVVFFVCVLILAWINQLASGHEHEDAQNAFNAACARMERRLAEFVSLRADMLTGLATHLALSSTPVATTWAPYLTRLSDREVLSHRQIVLYAPFIPGPASEPPQGGMATMTQQGAARVTLTFPAGNALDKLPGIDLLAQPAPRDALLKAAVEDEPRLSQVFPALGEPPASGTKALILVTPVFNATARPSTTRGWVGLLIPVTSMLNELFDAELPGAHVEIFDVKGQHHNLIFERANSPQGESAKRSADTILRTRVVNLAGRSWEIHAAQDSTALTHTDPARPIALAFGLFGAAMVSVVIHLLQRKRANLDQARTFAFLQRVMDSLPTPIFVKDDQHRYRMLNKAFGEAFAVDTRDMIGKSDAAFHPEAVVRTRFAEDDLALQSDRIQVTAQEDTDNAGRSRAWIKSKARIRLSETQWGVCGILTEITAQKQAEQEARTSRMFLDAVVNALPQPMYVKNAEGKWVVVNEAFARLLGTSKADLLDKSDVDFWDANTVARYDDHDRLAMASQLPVSQEDEVLLPDGSRNHLITSKCAISLDDGARYIICVIFDNTRQKQISIELEHAHQFLNAIINALPQSLLVVKDEAHRYILVNRTWCEAVGIEAKQVLGKTSAEVFPRDVAEQLEAQDREAWSTGKVIRNVQPRINLNGLKGWSLKTKQVVTLPSGLRYNVQVTADVTDEQNALHDALVSRRLLEGVIDAIPSPLFVKDLNQRFLLVNAAAQNLGTTTRIGIGLSDSDIFPADLCARYAKEDADVLATNETRWFNDYRTDENGRERWWMKSKRGISLPDDQRMVVTLMTDVTSLKLAERNLLRKQDRLRVLNDISLAIVQESSLARLGAVACSSLQKCFPNCRVSMALRGPDNQLEVRHSRGSPQLPDLTPRSLDLSALPHLWELLSAGDVQVLDGTDTDAEIGRKEWMEYLAGPPAHSTILIPLSTNDEILGFLWIDAPEGAGWATHEIELARETSQYLRVASHHHRMKAEREAAESALRVSEAELRRHRDDLQSIVEERTRDLREAIRMAEEANQAKSQFFANMSHELRTPLHSIISFTKLGLEQMQSAAQTGNTLHQYLSRIDKSGGKLLQLINDVLDLAKLEAGRMTYQFEQRDLREIIDDVVEEQVVVLQENDLRLQSAFSTHNTGIWCDAFRMEQVLRNVLSNAIKFSPRGGAITIAVSETLMHDDRDRQGADVIDALEISVSDEGTGIPAGEFELIFDKFSQSSKTKSRSGGTGLGLPIAREIVVRHGGQILASNGARGGAVLTLILPRSRVEDPEDGASPALQSETAPPAI